MINIVIPMAGAGSRFSQAGFKVPKPLIEVHGMPMIKIVIGNLKPLCAHQFIFICQENQIIKYKLIEKLNNWAPNCKIIATDKLTDGAACTVLLSKKTINNSAPLMIANSDQFIDVNINEYLANINSQGLDGMIMTMKANDPKWSYVALNNQGLVIEVAEKKIISNNATVGIYNFNKGCDFVEAAEEMILKGERINGEFYVAPVYNNLINRRKKIGIYNVGSEGFGMYGLGIPSDLTAFVNNPISKVVLNENY